MWGGRLGGFAGAAYWGGDLARLRKMGYSVVVSLECDRLNTFEIQDAGFEHKKICVEDFSAPTLDQVDDFVAFVDSKIAEGKKVLVHCFAGRGRTGTMLAAYLIHQGMSAEAAVREIRARAVKAYGTLRGVHVRVLRVSHDLLDPLDRGDVILRRAAADVEDASPRGLQLDLRDLVVVLDRVERDRLLALLHAVVMVLRERDADRRIVQGRDEIRDAFSIARPHEAVRILRRDSPHVPQDFAAAVRPRFERIGEGRALVVALAEQGLVSKSVVHPVEAVLPQDDVVRVRGRPVMVIAVRLLEVVIGDCNRRHDDVDEAELDHVAHHLLQAARREGAGAAEKHRALRVRHHVLQDGGAQAQGPRLERDVLVAVDEVRDRLGLLKVEMLDRYRCEVRLRGLLV